MRNSNSALFWTRGPLAEFSGKIRKFLRSLAEYLAALAFLCCHYIDSYITCLIVSFYLSTEKARLLSTAFINSESHYASLIWMFAGKTLIPKVQKIHFRTLQMVYNTYEKSYNELLILNRDKSIHQKHLHFWATEVYKPVNNLNPEFMWNYFNFSTLPYELRKGNKVNLPETRTCHCGIKSLLFRGALL